eukprot:scaffold231941_cov15-Tisochrysis_lutea.AAC.1
MFAFTLEDNTPAAGRSTTKLITTIFIWFGSPKSLAAACLAAIQESIDVTNKAGASLGSFTAHLPPPPHSGLWGLARAADMPALLARAAQRYQPDLMNKIAALAPAMAADTYAPTSGTTKLLPDCLFQIIEQLVKKGMPAFNQLKLRVFRSIIA